MVARVGSLMAGARVETLLTGRLGRVEYHHASLSDTGVPTEQVAVRFDTGVKMLHPEVMVRVLEPVH